MLTEFLIMGNSFTHNPLWLSTNFDIELSEETLTHIKTIEDVRLGQVDEFQHKPTNTPLLKKVVLLDKDTQLTDDNLRKLKARVHLRNDSLLRIYGFKLDLSEDGTNKIEIFFETFVSDSMTEFLAHQKDQSFFTEEELYESILTLLRVLAYLQKHHVSHGHLIPDSVFMSAEGDIKLLDHSLFERENSAYFACLQGAKIPYISPELVALLDKNTPIPESFIAFKADVFSLGMTFLFGALLEEPVDCYDWENCRFNESKLLARLDRVRAKYPGRLTKLLSHMLKTNPTERPDAVSLLTNLPEYERDDLKFSASTHTAIKSGKGSRKASGHSEKDLKYSQSYADYQRPADYYYTSKETPAYGGSHLSFVDPKVAQVIKEIKEKKWNKSQSGSPYRSDIITSPERREVASSVMMPSYHEKYQSPERTTAWEASTSERDLRYRNPFIENYGNYLSHSSFIPTELPKKTPTTEVETYRLSFNTPEVNQVISDLKNIMASPRRESPVMKQSEYIEHQYVSRSPIEYEKSIGVSSSYKVPEMQQSFESPKKLDYNQLVRETDKYFWGSGIKTSNPDIPIETSKYQKKIQSKEEIIKELRGKYGSKTAQKNEEVEEKKVIYLFIKERNNLSFLDD